MPSPATGPGPELSAVRAQRDRLRAGPAVPTAGFDHANPAGGPDDRRKARLAILLTAPPLAPAAVSGRPRVADQAALIGIDLLAGAGSTGFLIVTVRTPFLNDASTPPGGGVKGSVKARLKIP